MVYFDPDWDPGRWERPAATAGQGEQVEMGTIGTRIGGVVAMVLALAGGVLGPAAARAAAPPLFWQQPEDGKGGSGAGQLDDPRGLAADPTNGHVYVSDGENGRISEFTAWGEFVKAWGWGVVGSGPGNKPQNERQEVTVDATGGTFGLRFTRAFNDGSAGEQDSGAIVSEASADTIREALEGLESLSPGDVAVSGAAGGPWVIEFTGKYADTDILPFRIVNSTLTGGSATGSVKTIQGGANFEICLPAEGDVCRRAGQGTESGEGGGASPGQFTFPSGITADSSGNVYVVDVRGGGEKNARVQKFDSEGHFLLMFGGEVNKTTKANVCTKEDLEGGDKCGVGTFGTGNGQFAGIGFNDYIDVGPAGTIFVGDKDRIQEFNPNGTYKAEVPLPGETVRGLAVDAAGNFDLTLSGKENIRKLNPSGGAGVPASFPAKSPSAVTVDSAGNVYAVDDPTLGFGDPASEPRVIGFDPTGKAIIPSGELFTTSVGVTPNGLATSTACKAPSNVLYASFLAFMSGKSYARAYGSHPEDAEKCPPPIHAPEIQDQYTVSAEDNAATVQAQINPHFWPDTAYYVEYGTEECSKGGCKAQLTPPGDPLGGGVVKAPVTTTPVFLSSLEPGTTYHYRFVSQSSGGGPVYGIDPDGEGPKKASFEEGLEDTFTTFPLPVGPNTDCPNQAFRNGPAAFLPDCRAYEMVSPVDKENGDISVLKNINGFPARLVQAVPGGGKVTYSSYRTFGEATSAPYTAQYIASREGDGWSSEAIAPPREGNTFFGPGRFDVQYKAFSDNLCRGWLLQDTEPVLDPAAPLGVPNFYQRDNCGGGGHEALITAPLTFTAPRALEPELQAFSGDGRCAVLRVNDKLTEDASTEVLPGGTAIRQVYGSCKEGAGRALRLISFLPGGAACDQNASVGTVLGFNIHRQHAVWQALSTDGTRVFWSCGKKLYVRDNADQDPSELEGGECSQAAVKACTYPVSAGDAQFWGADSEGSTALFTSGGDLYEFDFENKESALVAKGVAGLLGASEDLSRFYLVSSEELDEGATDGKPNLYLHEGGGFRFIATLSGEDVHLLTPFSDVQGNPSKHRTRVSPDGLHAAFSSTAPLTGYDSTDVGSDEADAEVFLYDAAANGGAGELLCVSCNPSGARPLGREFEGFQNVVLGVAAQLPTWESQLYPERALSEDGSRLFFESFDALVLRDTNGKGDVYEWERGASEEDCVKNKGAELFVAKAGGCLSLISSGESPEDSEFLDASLDGSDVFFVTALSLLSQDYGLIDLYDARVGGGFPPPPTPIPHCAGEACQSPPAPPDDPTPGSSTSNGSGNAKAPATKPHCAKGKRRVGRGGKARCVRKHKKQHGQGRRGQRRAG